jgi:hypothetical protein
MKLGAFEARFSFGLLVISDPGSKDRHDDWDPREQRVHAGTDSLYVSVRGAASGLVTVTCTDDITDYLGAASNLLFSGSLELPATRLKFYDPDKSICMTVPVHGSRARVEIYADDAEEPSELLVQVISRADS